MSSVVETEKVFVEGVGWVVAAGECMTCPNVGTECGKGKEVRFEYQKPEGEGVVKFEDLVWLCSGGFWYLLEEVVDTGNIDL